MLANLIFLSAVTAINVVDESHGAFRAVMAEINALPNDTMGLIDEWYQGLIYGTNPVAPIRSVSETAALFPPGEHYYYIPELIEYNFPTNVYLTLHHVEENYATESRDIVLVFNQSCDEMGLYMKVDSSIIPEEETRSEFSIYKDSNTVGYNPILLDQLDIQRDVTDYLFYIPPNCPLKLEQLNSFQHFVWNSDDVDVQLRPQKKRRRQANNALGRIETAPLDLFNLF